MGSALVDSNMTHAIAFTGSVGAGQNVAAAAARRMKPAVIEAGGSDPMIITGHAPITIAAAGAVTGAFHMSGQVCTSTERLYVVDSIHDEFVAAFVAETKRLRIGNGLDKSENRTACQSGGARQGRAAGGGCGCQGSKGRMWWRAAEKGSILAGFMNPQS